MRPSPFVLDMRPSHNWCKCDPEGQGFAWRIHGDFLAEKCWGAKGKLWIGAWKEWVRGRVGWGRLRLGDRGGGGRSWWFDGRRNGHPSGSPSVESISLRSVRPRSGRGEIGGCGCLCRFGGGGWRKNVGKCGRRLVLGCRLCGPRLGLVVAKSPRACGSGRIFWCAGVRRVWRPGI